MATKKRFFLLFFILVCNCFVPQGATHSESEIQERINKSTYQMNFDFIEFENRKIHFAKIGEETLPPLVLIHGSPGTWDGYLDYLLDKQLLTKYLLISYDRPGFGKSTPKTEEASLKKQAEIIHKIIKKLNKKEIYLLGHSFGGPIAFQYAIDYPLECKKLFILAGSVDPEQEKEEWFQTLGNLYLIRKIIPSALDVSNQEILALKAELSNMLNFYNSIRIPIVVYHGEEDSLVPIQNAYFIKKNLKNANVNLIIEKNLNHFIPWNRKEKVIELLLE
jgi:pimeloyl-ACP methyl ester carboxylesterase